ncbi:uncharacterized protein FMAN_09929 [Fusarium mangiferae]|uniref:Uncharacterized protein n=1 Tax=Fusarium mangiferae TaxID=192010 RepID=A0A1L7TPC4_FUSMA|nr:uncharacterized protein FMAN_09929 [Fusarium mangiferae]CVL00508.1 uncharacterized protein FMAN_09929 [Fusarium mangiferae]
MNTPEAVERCVHLISTLRRYGCFDDQRFESAYKTRAETVSADLKNWGAISVDHTVFRYTLESAVWKDSFCHLDSPPEFPWSITDFQPRTFLYYRWSLVFLLIKALSGRRPPLPLNNECDTDMSI